MPVLKKSYKGPFNSASLPLFREQKKNNYTLTAKDPKEWVWRSLGPTIWVATISGRGFVGWKRTHQSRGDSRTQPQTPPAQARFNPKIGGAEWQFGRPPRSGYGGQDLASSKNAPKVPYIHQKNAPVRKRAKFQVPYPNLGKLPKLIS